MSDIVVRLRECDPHKAPDTAQLWMREAAARIELYTAEISALKFRLESARNALSDRQFCTSTAYRSFDIKRFP